MPTIKINKFSRNQTDGNDEGSDMNIENVGKFKAVVEIESTEEKEKFE